MKPLLDIDQCSDLVNLKKSTLYKKVCKREIPFVKINGSLRFRPEEIEEWIEEKSVEALR
jgi:excisionase family DNA binding protein